MKKFLLFAVLLCCVNVYAQQKSGTSSDVTMTTVKPTVEYNSSRNVTVEKVAVSSVGTFVTLSGAPYGSNYKILVNSEMKLLLTDKYGVEYKYPIIMALDDDKLGFKLDTWYYKSSRWTIELMFPRIPSGYTSISVQEPQPSGGSGAWKFNGIKINNPAKSPITESWLRTASAKDIAREFVKASIMDGDFAKACMCLSGFSSLSDTDKKSEIAEARREWEESDLGSTLLFSEMGTVTQRTDPKGEYDAIVDVELKGLVDVTATVMLSKRPRGWTVEDVDME